MVFTATERNYRRQPNVNSACLTVQFLHQEIDDFNFDHHKSHTDSQHTTASVDSRRTECLPHNRLTDIGCNEQRDARAETVAFLQQLVKQQDNQPGNKQLDDDKQTDTGSDLRRQTIHASHHVDNSLSDCDHHAKH